MRCHQAHNLLSLVEELTDELERLRRIRDSEEEIEWWSTLCHALEKLICHPLHKKQWIPYPFTTRQA